MRQIDYDFDFLLDRYAVDKFSTPAVVPGLGRVGKFEYSEDGRLFTQWNAICGGVSIAFNRDMKEHDDDGMAEGAGSRVLVMRPDITAISWDINGPVLPISRDMVTDGPKLATIAGDAKPPVLESIADILKRHPATTTPAAPGDAITDILKRFGKP